MDLLMTYSELARLFPVAEGTLRSWVCEDDIPTTRRGRRKVVPFDRIQRAYDKRHPGAAAA